MTAADHTRVTFEHISSIRDIPFTDRQVIVADRQLPAAMLAELPDPILVEGGEGMKTLSSVASLAEQVLERRSSRPLTLVAVGGGSVGDAVAFLASILWRGVDLWHVPTTLLAMVDSAHGGKTAVNLGTHKNQLGTWYPSGRTYIVDDVLESMPLPLRREGLAEILKVLMLNGEAHGFAPATMERLATAPFEEVRDILQPLVERAIWIKMDIVARDPQERHGIRTLLNLGHTLSHALELTAHLSHGGAVAWGLATMLDISRGFGLTDERFRAFRALVHPLLQPLPDGYDTAHVRDAMLRDKKRVDDALRSVVLSDDGAPHVTDGVSAEMWIEAFARTRTWFHSTPVHATLHTARRVTLRMEPGKSELNRALILAALRPGRTDVAARSSADDVQSMVRALRLLDVPLHDTREGWCVDHMRREDFSGGPGERIAHCGDGGTTFRFLLAFACMNAKETVLLASSQLLARPHEALLRSLRSGGARIEPVHTASGDGYRVRGWDSMPTVFSVDVTESSQFASAIALLAAGAESPFTLRLMGKAVSTAYMDMTVRMLEEAGVECIRSGDLLAFNQTDRLKTPITLTPAPDASAEAVWKVAAYFEHPLKLETDASAPQPDSVIDTMLDAIRDGQRGEAVTLACGDCPDLVPLLCVAALRSRVPVHLTGIAHLRHKESDRLNGLAASFAEIGIALRTDADSVTVPGGAISSLRKGCFHSHGDHRMVMAGLMLSMVSGDIELDEPWSVTKSYPSFWNDARAAGWTVQAVDTTS